MSKFWLILVCLGIICSLSTAYDPDTVDVHIVCHSHTDAGWYQSYDSYFRGRVIPILNRTIDAVHSGDKYKFNWADTSFLAKWYREIASEDQKKKLHDIVKDGKWQFMGGGWVMNDESLTSYKNVLLQLQSGINFLEETFGPEARPKIGYQIDPFGNSAVTPSLLSALGYEGIVLSRIGTTFDWDLETSENSEFIWQGSDFDDSEDGKPILAHHLVRSKYQGPVEFKFQANPFPFWVHPRMMCTNKEELTKNYKKCVKLFWDEVVSPSLTGHRHNQVYAIFGEDFSFSNAGYSFNYIDDFMEVMREKFEEVTGKKINIFYSTVNEYFDAVKNFNNGDIKFPVYKGDFLPYVQLEDGTFDHWVGYYSSTPALKQMIRHLFQRVRSIKLETVLGFLKNEYTTIHHDKLREIKEETSILMHHDAITSTSPSGTLKDYEKRIGVTERKIDELEKELLKTFTRTNLYQNSAQKKSALEGTELITIFNPLGYERTELANFTSSSQYVQLYDSEGKIVENSEIYIEYLDQYTGKTINTRKRTHIVIFEAKFEPLSYSKYFFKELNNESQCSGKCVKILSTKSPNGGSDMKLENTHVEITIKAGQLISSYRDKWSGITVSIPTTFHTYPGRSGQTTSGLYIFNPTKGSTERALRLMNRNIQEGDLVSTIHSIYKLEGTQTTLSQAITLNHCSNLGIQRSVRVVTKMNSQEYYEFVMRTDMEDSFGEEDTMIYVDNGADNHLKQFYTFEEAKEFNLTKNSQTAYNGLNGFASIYGTAFRSPNDTFFGFVNSNPLLVNPIKRNQYEIMLMRNTNYYDDKGITSPLVDQYMETFDQILFAVQGVKEFDTVQKELSAVLNDKLQIRKTGEKFTKDMDTLTYQMLPSPGISAGFGDVDIIDIDLIKGSKEFAQWQLRSRMPYNVTLHPSFKIHSEAKKGSEINTNKPFLADPQLAAPLAAKRLPYTEIKQDFLGNMTFATYSSPSKKERIHGFVDVVTPLKTFKTEAVNEKVDYYTLADLKGKSNGDKEGQSGGVPIGTEPCPPGKQCGTKPKGYPTPSPGDPKPPSDPFDERRNPASHKYDVNRSNHGAGGDNCGHKDIPVSSFIWTVLKIFGVALLAFNLVLFVTLFYLKNLRKGQAHRYVMY